MTEEKGNIDWGFRIDPSKGKIEATGALITYQEFIDKNKLKAYDYILGRRPRLFSRRSKKSESVE